MILLGKTQKKYPEDLPPTVPHLPTPPPLYPICGTTPVGPCLLNPVQASTAVQQERQSVPAKYSN